MANFKYTIGLLIFFHKSFTNNLQSIFMGLYAHATWSEHVIPLAISSFNTTKILSIYY
jgi:hypothetical protein